MASWMVTELTPYVDILGTFDILLLKACDQVSERCMTDIFSLFLVLKWPLNLHIAPNVERSRISTSTDSIDQTDPSRSPRQRTLRVSANARRGAAAYGVTF